MAIDERADVTPQYSILDETIIDSTTALGSSNTDTKNTVLGTEEFEYSLEEKKLLRRINYITTPFIFIIVFLQV